MRFASIRPLGLAFVAVLAFTGGSVVAAQANQPAIDTKNMHIETSHFRVNDKTGEFTMPDRVHFTRPGTDLVGDRAKGNEKSENVVVTGNVVLHNAGGFQPNSVSPVKVGSEPQTITCDELAVDAKAKNYVATGNMHFTQGVRSATAARGQLDEAHHLLTLDGGVEISDAKQSFRGDHMTYDTVTGDVHANGGPGVLDAPGIHVETQQYDYNELTGDFQMPQHVHFVRDGTDATGDHASGNTKDETVLIEGHVVLHNTGAGYTPQGKTTKKSVEDPQTLTCDTLAIDSKNKHYIATGHMVYVQTGRKAVADKGDLDDLNHKLALDGNVRIDSEKRTFRGDHMTYDTESGDFEATGRPGVITAPVATPKPKAPKPTKAPRGRRPSPTPNAASPVAAPSVSPSAKPAR